MWQCRPSSVEARGGHDPPYRLEGVAGGDREAELLVLVRGGDVLVGVRLDAGGHPDHHPRRCSPARAVTVLEPLDLVEGVDDDPAHPGLDARGAARRSDLLLPW